MKIRLYDRKDYINHGMEDLSNRLRCKMRNKMNGIITVIINSDFNNIIEVDDKGSYYRTKTLLTYINKDEKIPFEVIHEN